MNVRIPEAGETLVGKYLLHRLLGRGGVGVVYEGEHLRLRQRVAIKLLAPEMLAHREMVERFEREARAMALLQSAHVTRVTDVDITPDGVPFLVMEFLQGNDLQHELKSRGALPIAEAVHWVRQACIGMAVVHGAGIVHRDLKPANLFLVDGDPRALKIMDFGISKIAGEDFEMTMTQTTLGTPAYMSPEQVKSAKNIDVRADVWSLGVILYRALTGKLPFQGSGSTGMAVAIVNDTPIPIESLRPDLPPALVNVVRRTLEKSADARLPTVRALADALAPFEGLTSAPTAAPEPPVNDAGPSIAGQSLHTTVVRRRSVALPIAIVGAVVACAVAVFIVTRTPEPPAYEPAAKPKPTAKPEPVVTETPAASPSPSPSLSPSPSASPSHEAPTAKPPSKPAEPTPPKKDPPKPKPSSMPVLL